MMLTDLTAGVNNKKTEFVGKINGCFLRLMRRQHAANGKRRMALVGIKLTQPGGSREVGKYQRSLHLPSVQPFPASTSASLAASRCKGSLDHRPRSGPSPVLCTWELVARAGVPRDADLLSLPSLSNEALRT